MFQKVSAGDGLSIAADDWNAVIDAARDHKGRGRPVPPGMPLRFAVYPSLTILVRNDTGEDLPAFSVLTVATADPIDNVPTVPSLVRERPALPGDTPTVSTDPFCVTIDPIAKGVYGRAVVAGVVPCQVVKGATGDKWAKAIAGDNTRLAGGSGGTARILWSETGTGEKWAVILLGGAASVPTWTIHVWRVVCDGGTLRTFAYTVELRPDGTSQVVDNSSCHFTTAAGSGHTVNFTGTYTPGPGSPTFAWDFGDMTGTSAAQNPTYTYAAAGTYTVTFTVTYGDGYVVTSSANITVS